ncbi:hypothetical protein AAFF_G00086290 [Aldrovandia affinis]|uniref:Secreted protein n=1 Tax=Aldrovandia affinis TaxID=143900 RepID=A0AAD7WD82_9TELE|nr:hypothetical protein AAFF_G00086290 [Aldrovandia affinis]
MHTSIGVFTHLNICAFAAQAPGTYAYFSKKVTSVHGVHQAPFLHHTEPHNTPWPMTWACVDRAYMYAHTNPGFNSTASTMCSVQRSKQDHGERKHQNKRRRSRDMRTCTRRNTSRSRGGGNKLKSVFDSPCCSLQLETSTLLHS